MPPEKGPPLHDPCPAPDAERILHALWRLASSDRSSDLVSVDELCRILAVQREWLEPRLLELQAEGSLICAPSSGRIALVSPTQKHLA
jgi:hypothetical protein